jgi:putative transposase
VGLKAKSGAHSRHVLTYHLIWCVKYRHTLLTRQIGDRAKEIISEIATQIGAEIIEIETDTDHVHLIVRLNLNHKLSRVPATSQASTARALVESREIRRHRWRRTARNSQEICSATTCSNGRPHKRRKLNVITQANSPFRETPSLEGGEASLSYAAMKSSRQPEGWRYTVAAMRSIAAPKPGICRLRSCSSWAKLKALAIFSSSPSSNMLSMYLSRDKMPW